jgi:mannan endo-1,4-beta-mannosidase
MMRTLFFLLILIAATGASARETSAQTMNTQGRHLHTAAGERVVLRGVNEMFAWSRIDPTGAWTMDEIAKTGANSVRIVTTLDTPAPVLDALIGNAIASGMIPMPECHSATGRWERLPDCVDYWVRPDVAEVINRHERWVLLNIANEAGRDVVPRDEFTRAYQAAITQIRDAGIRVPLVIDGAGYGQEYRILLDSWKELNEHDPHRAVIVSAHSYWNGTEEERKNHYRYIIDRVTRDEIPFVVGEGPTPSAWDCTPSPYLWAMTELDRAEIGWLAWSWGLQRNGDCNDPPRYDMTHDGRYGNWKTESGRILAVDHPASIRNTARRPCSIPNAGDGCVAASAAGRAAGGGTVRTRREAVTKRAPEPRASVRESLRRSLAFHASFDGGVDADFARGDPRLYHAPSREEIAQRQASVPEGSEVGRVPGAGRYGDALRLSLRSEPVVFFRGRDNLPFAREDWSGTLSFWLRLDPDEDLRPGYSDPVFVTDRSWDDRSLFVDFTSDDTPRRFRFAAFADRAVWNPERLEWDEVPVGERPMVEVRDPPFRRDRWTHIVLAWERFNTGRADGAMHAYLDGRHVGSLTGRTQTYSWNPDEVIVRLGLDYNGLIDDLSLFDRALSPEEVRYLFGLENGVREIRE